LLKRFKKKKQYNISFSQTVRASGHSSALLSAPCAFVSSHGSPCGVALWRAVLCFIAMDLVLLESDTEARNPVIDQGELQPSLLPYVPFPTFPPWKSQANVIRTVNGVFDNPDPKAVAALPAGIHRGPFGTSWGTDGLTAAKLYLQTWAADRTKGGGGFTLGVGGHRAATRIAGRMILLRCSYNHTVSVTIDSAIILPYMSTPPQCS
jgi:hypothetical protein